MRNLLTHWTIDYGSGPTPVEVPHAWRQDVSVEWEGPAVYRARLDHPGGPGWLRFHGVSYEATVSLNGVVVTVHRGIWDAWDVALPEAPGPIDIEVAVRKNGGPTYPVRDVASGFLPFVYHTFGGIFREVEVLTELPPRPAPTPVRVAVDGSRILLDGRPFYPRGVLTWGWYPEVGHPNPPDDAIRHEVRAMKALGFNLVKFCLWVPSHRYLEILAEEGMLGWLELPIWDPSPDPERLEAIAGEVRRVAEQYAHHRHLIVWTVGCELSDATPPAYRAELVEQVKAITGCPLVKDNSGGAEMYGGDPREFGDFEDFHPYCDTPFYPPVLDSLLTGPRTPRPILLGEFNDIDVHRDLPRTRTEAPYWASSEPNLNAVGVRWQYDLPRVLASSRYATASPEEADLRERSRAKAAWMRKHVQEAVRARSEIAGYVVTGWRDTPISSAGYMDDWEGIRFSHEETAPWNEAACLFLIPSRRPPWVRGGNRPGWTDPYAVFEGVAHWRLGIHTEAGASGPCAWRIVDGAENVMATGGGDFAAEPLRSTELGAIVWERAVAGEYRLQVLTADATNEWPIRVVARPDFAAMADWGKHDPLGLFDDLPLKGGPNLVCSRLPQDHGELLEQGARMLLFATDTGTLPMPFWREAAYPGPDPALLGHLKEWAHWLGISPDAALDPAWLDSLGLPFEHLMTRVDARTYAEHPIVARSGGLIVTTLRPFGGLGSQPHGVRRNPIGAELLARWMAE